MFSQLDYTSNLLTLFVIYVSRCRPLRSFHVLRPTQQLKLYGDGTSMYHSNDFGMFGIESVTGPLALPGGWLNNQTTKDSSHQVNMSMK